MKARLILSILLATCLSVVAQTSTLRGTVTDPTGAPIPKASVGLHSAEADWDTRTDSEGKFQFIEVPPGTYELEVKSQGFTPKLLTGFTIGGLDSVPLAIKLQVGSCPPCCGSSPGCDVADITYSDTSTKPVLKGQLFSLCKRSVFANASVELSKMEQSKVLATARTGKNGRFQFADLDPGRYKLRFSGEGQPDAWAFNVRVEHGKISEMTQELGASWMVTYDCSARTGPGSKDH